ncbi:uncharacterized protein LOC118435540 [Folsomia candida]|nr:uncharacterized protein LOC118435540 [Folsomia candida]
MWGISKMVETYHLRHTGITSLEVGCTHYAEFVNVDGQTAGKLVTLFPGVKEFKLKLGIGSWSDWYGPEDFLNLKEIMRSLSDWALTSGKVEIRIKRVRKDLNEKFIIAVLEGMTEWKGLKNTSLRFYGCNVREKFRILDAMRAAILACNTIRNVAIEGFPIDDKPLEAFREFIRENNLSVSITNLSLNDW